MTKNTVKFCKCGLPVRAEGQRNCVGCHTMSQRKWCRVHRDKAFLLKAEFKRMLAVFKLIVEAQNDEKMKDAIECAKYLYPKLQTKHERWITKPAPKRNRIVQETKPPPLPGVFEPLHYTK